MFSYIKQHYQETIQYLYDLQLFGIKLGLDNIRNLLTYWNNPQNKWSAIHVAGTNGKGSTAAFIYNILKEAGFKVGLYTSPHLLDFCERIRINDKLIPWQQVVDYTTKIRPVMEKIKPTFFEATSAIAFRYFADQGVDIAVIETGLGGRLDATNLVNPIATVITGIHFDHQQFLGHSLRKIAGEKAGIVKSQIPCFTYNDGEALDIIKKTCQKKRAPLYLVNPQKVVSMVQERFEKSIINMKLPRYELKNLTISLPGIHQISNAILAIITLVNLPGLKIQKSHIRAGCKKISWPGRFQILKMKPIVILDVAHNPQGFDKVFEHIKKHFIQNKIFVLVGLSEGKDYRKIADIIKRSADFIGLVNNFSNKSLPAYKLQLILKKMNIHSTIFNNIQEGYTKLLDSMNSNDILLITGSHYLIGEFFKKIQNP